MVMAVHPHHQAGSPYWAKWYRGERAAGRRQTEVADLLLKMAEQRALGAAAGLAKMHAAQKEKLGDALPKAPKPPKARPEKRKKVALGPEEARPGRPKGVNPGILAMRERNRLIREAKLKNG